MGSSQRKPKEWWHSRRHETGEAQDAARESYRTRAKRRPRQRWDADARQWVKVPR